MAQIHTEEGKSTESFIVRGMLERCKENEAEVENTEVYTWQLPGNKNISTVFLNTFSKG